MTHNPIYEFVKRRPSGQMMYFCSGVIILAHFPIFRKYMRCLSPVSLLLLLGRGYLLLSVFEPIALVSTIITVAYEFKWLHVFNQMGDFSYGILLTHFPVTRIFIHYGLNQYSFVLTLALTAILSTGLGMLPWKYTEKPHLYHPKKKA